MGGSRSVKKQRAEKMSGIRANGVEEPKISTNGISEQFDEITI